MSGLCVSSFILALVLALLAILSVWPGVLLPLALSIVALMTVDRRVRRGRAFAWWALALSLGGGWSGYTLTTTTHALAEHVGGSVVAALRASSKPDRDRLLDAWLVAEGREALRDRLVERFESAQRMFGPIQGGPVLPTVWAGVFPVFLAPAGLVAVDDPAADDAVPPHGTALWVRVPFEKAELHLALVLGKKDPQSTQEAMERLAKESEDFTRPVSVLRDARFFVRRAAHPALPAKEPTVDAPPREGGR
jgi:hypothetical protein